MTFAEAYLTDRHQPLSLEQYGLPARPVCTLVTPRFRASSHVISLVLSPATARPLLALKTARLAGDRRALDREAANLRALQASRPGGYDSIPRVVAYEDYRSHPVLAETALTGTPMSRAFVRRRPAACCDAVADWLIEVHAATRRAADTAWRERLIDAPLRRLAVAGAGAMTPFLHATRTVAAQLSAGQCPLVFEHGDLGHPNVLLDASGHAEVLDWETAEPAGLPICDLVFFLTYVAVARRRRWSGQTEAQAFDEAFWSGSAWARPYVHRYAASVGVQSAAVDALIVLTWPRYLDALLTRGGGPADDGTGPLSSTARWLLDNRFFGIWQQACARVPLPADLGTGSRMTEG